MPLPAGDYELSIKPCPFAGCSSALPRQLKIVVAETTTLTVDIATFLRAPGPGPDPLEALVSALEAKDLSVQVGERGEFLLSVPTTHLRVDDRDVFAFIFESDSASLEETTAIAPSGATIAKRQLLWPQPPSFFRMGRLIVFLLSENEMLLDALEQFLGPRFAGGDVPGFDVVPIISHVAESAARSALAQRLGVSSESLILVKSTPTEFEDTSLGCPEEEAAYAQVIVAGYTLLYEASGRRHPYHVAADGQIGTDCVSGVMGMVPFRPIDSTVDVTVPAALVESDARVAAVIVLRTQEDLDQYLIENAGALTIGAGDIDWSAELIIGALVSLTGCTGESDFTRVVVDDQRAQITAVLSSTEAGDCEGLLLMDRWISIDRVSTAHEIVVSSD